MSSPFLRNRQTILASIAGAGAAVAMALPVSPDPASEAGQEYAALKVLLDDNRRTLSDTASHEARQPMKAEFAKVFAPWIAGILEADQPVQDEVLLTNMIWALDYRNFDYALQLASFAIRHELAMPDDYKRRVACFLREELAELALKEPEAVPHDILVSVDSLTAEGDMPDPAKAKLHKALGRSWEKRAADFDASADNAPAGGAAAYAQAGLDHLQRALQLDSNAGVKKDIGRLEKLLRDERAKAEGSEK